MADFTQAQVDKALRGLGAYRVQVAQELAADGSPDAFSGALLLALGLRETGLRNINNPAETDHGCFQISELYHAAFLRGEAGCPAGTWKPESGHTAIEDGYCPRFTPACAYALQVLKDNYAYAVDNFTQSRDLLPFAVAAYNAGRGGAMRGLREGDVDKYTTGRDYSRWVIAHRTKVNHFLVRNPRWRV